MFGQDEEYQDDFESYSDEDPVKSKHYSPFNNSITEFNRTQRQIKNYIKNVISGFKEQPSTSTTAGLTSVSSSNSKADSSPHKRDQQIHLRILQPPKSLKVQSKQPDTNMVIEGFKALSRQNPNGFHESSNNSFQNQSYLRERIRTSNQKNKLYDSRRYSIGDTNNNSQKKMLPQSPGPKGIELSFQINQSQLQQSLGTPGKPLQIKISNELDRQFTTNRDSQKIVNKQISQRNMGQQSVPIKIEVEPNISARCWAVFDASTGEFLGGKNEHVQREVASITKIMTCWVTLQLAKKLELEIDNTYFEVSYHGSNIGGTTANLCEGDQLTIKDCLFGLMLPSGNDAAVTLAENFGEYLDNNECFSDDDIDALKEYRRSKRNTKHLTDLFMSQMNLWAQKFGLCKTFYANPHGLINEKNKSTAYDVGQLCCCVIQDPVLQKIVQTKIYFSEIQDEDGYSKEVFWENTNKLLYKGYQGIKTGITTRAGPCVVEHFQDSKLNIIIVLLNCKSTDERWVDAAKIVNYFQRKYNGMVY